MGHTAERIAQAAHIIQRTPSQQERERIMQQLEQEGDFTAEGIEAVRTLTRHPLDNGQKVQFVAGRRLQ